jgi:hypothetical protein
MDELRATLSAPGTRRLSLRRNGSAVEVSLVPRDLSP